MRATPADRARIHTVRLLTLRGSAAPPDAASLIGVRARHIRPADLI